MDGQDLKRRREALGLSQAELGRLLGVMQNTVSRWELGLVVIRHPDILDLALWAIEEQRRQASPEYVAGFVIGEGT
jgi:transcriptional regulator with XRE-family HTH domain